ncbi:hypothetical protein KKD72_01845 [Patescibacteria group bacterium]|nr:hypothetical protein [Patescibacteria group bacterium]
MRKGLILLVSVFCLISIVIAGAGSAIADTKSDNIVVIASARQSVTEATGLVVGENFSLKPLSRSVIKLIFPADGKNVGIRFYVKSDGRLSFRGEYRVF